MYYADRVSQREYVFVDQLSDGKHIEAQLHSGAIVIRHPEQRYKYKLLIRKVNYLLSSYLIALKRGHRQALFLSRNL